MMKKYLILGIFCLSALNIVAQELNSTQQKNVSYSLGYQYGDDILSNDITLDIDNLLKGVEDSLTYKKSRLNDSQRELYLSTYFNLVNSIRKGKQAMIAKNNLDAAQEFLAGNAQKNSVKETESGLQYETLINKIGDKPSAEDYVTVHYRGVLVTGEEFDSSYKRNQPASFPLNRVIPGWTEGLQLMSVGSKYKFYIPPELAYGENPPAGSIIEANSVLIFEVELLGIN